MSQGCTSCGNEAQERNREYNNLIIKAKQSAVESNKPKAVCEDPVEGLFITEAGRAIKEFAQQIRYIASPI